MLACGVCETQGHLYAKNILYEKFLQSGFYKDTELEYRAEERIVDIFLTNLQGKCIAVECQASDIDITEFRKKTAYYSYKGIYCLWVFLGNPELDKRLLRLVNTKGSRLNFLPGEVEKKCHRWYYGRFYYFYNDKIYSIHFHPLEKWRPSSCEECLDEPRCIYKDKSQCSRYAPGYFIRNKKSVEISICPVDNMKLFCVDRKDRLRIAKFNEPSWWRV
jgi:competence CoiA-like predicted nuclease